MAQIGNIRFAVLKPEGRLFRDHALKTKRDDLFDRHGAALCAPRIQAVVVYDDGEGLQAALIAAAFPGEGRNFDGFPQALGGAEQQACALVLALRDRKRGETLD